MYEAYVTTLSIEAATMIQMVETGIVPACAKDLKKYEGLPKLAGKRPTLYEGIVDETEKLKGLLTTKPEDLPAEATYFCDTVKPQMAVVRKLVDEAEGLIEASLYPYPTYEALVYSHHA